MNRTFYSVSMTMRAVFYSVSMTMRAVFAVPFSNSNTDKYIYWSEWFCNLTVYGENIKRFYMKKNSNDTKMKDENLV